MANGLSGQRSYRCFYAPSDGLGIPDIPESGALPFVQLKAEDGEHAMRAAHHVTGCPVSSVERLDHAEA